MTVKEEILIFFRLSCNLDTQLGLCFYFKSFPNSCVCRELHKHMSRGRNQKEQGFSGTAGQFSRLPTHPKCFHRKPAAEDEEGTGR